MKYLKYLVLLIPIISGIFAVSGCGFVFRAGVSVSCAIILWLMSGKEISRSIRWVIAALLVSAVADWFMKHSGKVPVYFLYGVGLFFIAHAGFIVFCMKNGRINRWWLATLLIGYLTFFFVVLLPALTQPVLLAAVLAYLLISCFSLAAAAGLRLTVVAHWGYTAGIVLLVFSDTIIALRSFAGYGGLNFLILPTYFASHVVITMSLMKK